MRERKKGFILHTCRGSKRCVCVCVCMCVVGVGVEGQFKKGVYATPIVGQSEMVGWGGVSNVKF